MQGRKDPWDQTSNSSRSSLNGNNTGKQRAMPQRPPGMTRLDTPPATPRVNRPQRQQKPPRTWRRRLLIFSGVLVVLGILTFIIAYGVANLALGINSSAGASNTAADFLVNIQNQNYGQAYKDLDANITVTLQPQQFQQMAAADDACYGKITDYNEVSGSATTSNNGNTQSYTYSMTRSKLTKSYSLTLTIQKDSDGTWDITNFGGDLGPKAPSPTCK
jgi:hypothetical protein